MIYLSEMNLLICLHPYCSALVSASLCYFLAGSCFLWQAQQDSEKVTFTAPTPNPPNTPTHPGLGSAALFIRGTFYLSNTCHHSQANNRKPQLQPPHLCQHTSYSPVIHPRTHPHTSTINANIFTGVLELACLCDGGDSLHITNALLTVQTDGQSG